MELYTSHGAVPSVFSPFPEIQSTPNISSTSLNMQATMTAPSAAQSVGLCCHCGKGLPYETYHISCLFCDLNVCADCHRTHPAAHQPYFKYLLDRKTPRGARASQVHCTKCKLPSHSRLSCNDCEFNICVNCVATSRDVLANHAHRKLIMIRAPDDLGLARYSLQCDGCNAGATLSHCGRCLGGIRKGQIFWTCVTCIVDYNAQIRFCGDCQAPGLREHDPTHRIASFLYRVDIAKDPKYNSVKCLDCKTQVAFSGRELSRHPHSRFQLVMGEAERDRRYFQSYRTCARKPVRDMATISAEAHDILCGCCNHKLRFNAKVFMCPTCTMITCETCAESGGARSHSHIMFPVFLERTIPFALLGQGMAKPNTAIKHCAKCDASVNPESDSFIQCNHCEEWVICLPCTKRTNMPVRHSCSEAVEMTFFDPLKQANSVVIAKIMTVQKAKAAAAALRQQQSALQPSFSIRRKNPSIRSGSSISSISSVVPAAPAAELPQPSTTPQFGSQMAINQQLAQLSALGATGPLVQNSLPAIQPSIQTPVYGQEVRRKSLQPGLKNASRAMIDGSAIASKAAYNKASNMVDNIDKDSMKKVGKKLGAVAGALGGQALRQYVQQETGLTIPRINLNQKPSQATNQQAQVANAQRLEMQKLNALKQQLEMKQKILQLQNQVALQQQQQQQQQNQAALQQQQLQQSQNQAPMAGANIPALAANMMGQTQVGAPQIVGMSSYQAPPSSGVLHQPTPVVGGTNSIPPAIAGMSTPGPYNGSIQSTAPTPLSGASTTGMPEHSLSTPSSQPNINSAVHSVNANEMAPIPASEMQWATTHDLNPNHTAPMPLSEAHSANTHNPNSEMAPIPASELDLSHGNSTAPVPASESGMAPIPASEMQWATAHGLNPNNMASIAPSEAHSANVHNADSEMAPIPASELNLSHGNSTSSAPASESGMAPVPPSEQPMVTHSNPHDASHPPSDHANHANHGPHGPHAEGQHEHQTKPPASHSEQPPHDSEHHNNYHQPTVEEVPEIETVQSNTQGTSGSHPTSESGPDASHLGPSHHPLGNQHGPLSTDGHPHDFSYAHVNDHHNSQPVHDNHLNPHASHQSPHSSQASPANNPTFSPPSTPAPSQGGYQQLTPQSVGSPNVHSARPSLHNVPGSPQTHAHTSPSLPPGQPHYAHNVRPHPQAHSSNAQHIQNSQIPARPSHTGNGEADDYYQTHPLNHGGSAGGPSVNHPSHHQQQNIPHAQTNPQGPPPSLPPQNPITAMLGKPPQTQGSIPVMPGNTPHPSVQPLGGTASIPGRPQPGRPQPQNPITSIHPGANPGQDPPQINIHVQTGGAGEANGTTPGNVPAYNAAQMQQQANMNMQNQQIQALEQRLHMMNLQQQQSNQQLSQQLQSMGNQQNGGNSNLIEQLELQLLTSQLQGGQQQGSNQSLLQDGLSIINNLTSNNQSNNINSILQQQQQQSEIQALNFANQLNQMQAQSNLNAETIVLNDQSQVNLQLEQLNAQLASLNSTSGIDNTGLMSGNSLGVVDVDNYNVIDMDQSINMQSSTDLGFDMSGTDMGFATSSTDVVGFGTSSIDVGFDMSSSTDVGFDMSGTGMGFDMSSSTDVTFGMDDGSAFVSETTFDSVDVEF